MPSLRIYEEQNQKNTELLRINHMKKLPSFFFNRPTLQVAKELLGKVLVIGKCSGRINEVEAYIGQDDPASPGRRAPAGTPALPQRQMTVFPAVT